MMICKIRDALDILLFMKSLLGIIKSYYNDAHKLDHSTQ